MTFTDLQNETKIFFLFFSHQKIQKKNLLGLIHVLTFSFSFMLFTTQNKYCNWINLEKKLCLEKFKNYN